MRNFLRIHVLRVEQTQKQIRALLILRDLNFMQILPVIELVGVALQPPRVPALIPVAPALTVAQPDLKLTQIPLHFSAQWSYSPAC